MASSLDIAHAGTPASVTIGQIVLLTPNSVFEQRVWSVDDLVVYIDALKAEASTALTDKVAPFSCSLILLIKPGRRSKIWLMSPDTEALNALPGLKGALEKIAPTDVKDGPLALVVTLNIAGGGKTYPDGPPPLPEEWMKALPEGGGALDDAYFQRLWPD